MIAIPGMLQGYDNETFDMAAVNSTLELEPHLHVTITSYSLIYSTKLNGESFDGYVYEATVRGMSGDTTLMKKSVLAAVERCATGLSEKSALVGCCPFSHGQTWHGNLRLSAEPGVHSVIQVDCGVYDVSSRRS